jgi:hypothetical protein
VRVALLLAMTLALTSVARAQVPLRGGTPTERSAVRAALGSLRAPVFTRVEIGAPPEHTVPPTFIQLSLLTPRDDRLAANDVRTSWQAWTVASIFVRSPGVRPLGWLSTPWGGGLAGPRPLGSAPPVSGLVTSERVPVGRLAEEFAVESGVMLQEVEVVNKHGVASASITFDAADPAYFLSHSLRRFLASLAAGARLDNSYVAVDDELLGRRVFAWALSQVFSSGSYAVDPSLEGCSPVVSFGTPLGHRTPPCPSP